MQKPDWPNRDETEGPFSYGSCNFNVDTYYRENEKELKRLLFPETLQSDTAMQTAYRDADLATTTWIKAQLLHYGISFDPEIDTYKAKALLITSVAHGLVSQ